MEIPTDYRTRRSAAYQRDVLSRLSAANRITADAYLTRQYRKGNTPSSLVNICSYLLQLEKLNPERDFRTLTPEQIATTLDEYRKTHKQNSVFRFAVYLRTFLGWMHDDELPKAYRNVLKVKKPKKVSKAVLADDEFQGLLKAAWGRNLGQRGWMRQALLWLLWDSGFRISEALSLRIRDVKFSNDGGAHISLDANEPHLKTGARTVYVSECAPALRVWITNHPSRGDGAARLFPSSHRPTDSMEPTSVNRILANFSKSAGLNYVVTCHAFRHARATRAAKCKWNEHQLNAYFGWAPGSRESSTYVHLVAADIETEVRAAANIDPLGARIRGDPKAAFTEAVTAAAEIASEKMAHALLSKLGLLPQPTTPAPAAPKEGATSA